MAPDDLDRDKMYTAGADDLDSRDPDVSDLDDAELELEPPDPAVLAAAQRRAEEAINVHRRAIDVDEVYRDLDANRDSHIVEEWVARARNYRFQFQVKHLLILTAVVAIVLALRQWIGLGTAFTVAFMLAIAGVSLYLKLEENKRQEEADRRRRKMYAERRAQQAHASGQPIESETVESNAIEDEPPTPKLSDELREQMAKAREFRFQFSLSQLLVTITAAAILLGLGSAIGGASSVATICGLLALAGLVVPVLGLDPPPIVIFGWWMLLVLYVTLSLFSAVWASFGGA